MIKALPILIIFMVMMIGSKVLEVLKIVPDYLSSKNLEAVESKIEEKQVSTEKTADKLNNDNQPALIIKDKPDPLLFKYSQIEIDLLQELAKRRDELNNREQEISLKENALFAIEKSIQDKIHDLQNLQEKLKIILKLYEEKEDEKIKNLVKIYENMKPADAAIIFEKLEMDILIEVACAMKEAKLALIFGKMEPNRAKDLTTQMALRRKV